MLERLWQVRIIVWRPLMPKPDGSFPDAVIPNGVDVAVATEQADCQGGGDPFLCVGVYYPAPCGPP